MAQCLISLGSNLGERRELLARAAALVSSHPVIENFIASRLFQTPPIGGPHGQEPFLNAVAAFDTDATAADVLGILQDVESLLGRERRRRWDARSIDLDVVLHGDLIGGNSSLVVPHPRYTARRFVLVPALDVAAHYCDPRFGWTMRRLVDHLDRGPASIALAGGTRDQRQDLGMSLRREHKIAVVDALGVTATDQDRQITLTAETIIANTPGMRSAHPPDKQHAVQPLSPSKQSDWVSTFVPDEVAAVQCLPSDNGLWQSDRLPRLIVRIESVQSAHRWPSPARIWPTGGRYPEYRLEIEDWQWAVGEIASALKSMRCQVEPISQDGTWAIKDQP